MKKLPLSLLFSFAFCVSIFAGEIYVFHDGSCMDKLSSKEKTLTADYMLKTTANLISYNIKANENEYIRLEISEDGDEILQDMPIGTKNCNELIWDEQFVKEINSGLTDIFVVSLADGKYRISEVTAVSYFFSSQDELAYGNKDFGFNFDQGTFNTDQDLLTYGLKSKVKFNFADDVICPEEYHFYKSSKGRNLSENEMVIVPNFGVIRYYTISKKLNRNLREVEVQTVNDMPLMTYFNQMCTKTTENAESTASTEVSDQTITSEKVSEFNEKGEIEKPIEVKPSTTTSTLPMTTLPGAKESVAIQTCMHIFRNADTGIYYDRNTAKPANGECGGILYEDGLMVNSDYQTTTATTEMVMNLPKEEETEFVEKGVETTTEEIIPVEKVATTQATKPAEPKIVYKQVAPIIIDETLEPQDSKIIFPQNTSQNSISVDCAATPRTGYHMVKKGETLYKLSNLYDVSIQQIMEWNGLSTNEINVCTQLRIQAATSISQSASIIPANEFVSKGGGPAKTNIVVGIPSIKRQYHYIAQGETLYGISKKYNVSVADIKTLNKITGNYLKPGWRLLIPNSSDNLDTAKPPVSIQARPSTDYTPKGGSSMKIPESSEDLLNHYQNQHIYHTVGQNETIEDIALKYGVSINSVKILNEMSEGEVLIPFQKIKVR